MTLKPFVAYRERLAYIFPGQGSQYVGMSNRLLQHSAAAQEVYRQADRLLGYPLSQLCSEGPEDKLNNTYYAQPAIFVTSMAAWATLAESARQDQFVLPEPVCMSGHSLGLFSALVAAECLDFETGLRIVQLRGQVMNEAGELRPGGMAAIINLGEDEVEAICQEASAAGIVGIANNNAPGQIVIAGELEALAQAMEAAKMRGAKRVVQLPVSIASHSPLMKEASEHFAAELDRITYRDPKVPIINTLDGGLVRSAAEVQEMLRDHICNRVDWVTAVRAMVDAGAAALLEIGPGKVLSGLNRRIDRDLALFNTDDFWT